MIKVKIFGILRVYSGTAGRDLENGVTAAEIKSRLFGNQLDYSYIKVLLNGEHADDKTVWQILPSHCFISEEEDFPEVSLCKNTIM